MCMVSSGGFICRSKKPITRMSNVPASNHAPLPPHHSFLLLSLTHTHMFCCRFCCWFQQCTQWWQRICSTKQTLCTSATFSGRCFRFSKSLLEVREYDMWHDSWLIATRRPFIQHGSCTWDMTHDSLIWDNSYKTWLIHVGHDSFILDITYSYETRLIQMRHVVSICNMRLCWCKTVYWYETWLIHMRLDSFI